MPRLNLAYLPADGELARMCIEFARTNFAAAADGYLLQQKRALPHVTLAQFNAAEVPSPAWFAEMRRLCAPAIGISFEAIYFQRGVGEHEGCLWAGLRVRRSGLFAAQRRLVKRLREAGFEVLTATGEGYFPHLTLARLRLPPAAAPARWAINWPDADLWRREHRFALALGLSDPNGVLVQTLYPPGDAA